MLQRERVVTAPARTNYCSDKELMAECVEELAQYVGDVRYGSGTLDAIRNQAFFTLEDGRKMTLTFRFE